MSRPHAEIAVLNTGSSSVKATLFSADDQEVNAISEPWAAPGLAERGLQVRDLLGRLGSAGIVAHRLVHGGDLFHQPVAISPGVRERLAALEDLAPLHMQLGLAGVDAATLAHPGVPQFAVFDTAFHSTIPEAAATYALPADWRQRYGLRRYGFHGLSVAWSLRRVRELLGAVPRRMLVCHLGSGCSVTALLDGRSVDTTMGFTPLEGLPMATRSGSIDPGLILHLQRRFRIGADEILDVLEHRSGLLGLSGLSADLREIRIAAAAGNPECRLAVAHFTHALRRAIGAMAGVLGGANTIVFTGGIGEHDDELRASVSAAAGAVRIDRVLNSGSGDRMISGTGSAVTVLVIRSREDRTVLEAVRRIEGS